MVDFKKRLKRAERAKVLNPVKIYDSLDRASDKGPLRPVQAHILSEWHLSHRGCRDLIIKLHTGQGKTLIGLLLLQSRLNDNRGPALYLCPNHFLVDQTCTQAKQFGIAVVKADPDLPHEFFDGESILVTTVQKLFNGMTKFGLGPHSTLLGSLVMDDCHACIDSIKQACSITLGVDSQPYDEIKGLFEIDLRSQGTGTFEDICNGDFDAVLAVPYWSWLDHSDEVTAILSKHKSMDEIKFAWPLLRDMIDRCLCIVSGNEIEIVPYSPPLHQFGSFFDAQARFFMSATVTDDSFLIRGLGLDFKTIEEPLAYPDEKWCGEKMILLPSLLDGILTRDKVVRRCAKERKKREYGLVGLSPSFRASELWEEAGADVAAADSITKHVDALKAGKCSKALCIVNRYDGVDLPDDACRVLVVDSKPSGTSLQDRYIEMCRPDSEVMAQRTARIVEQGLGRSVRGEKDYCAIVLAGADLVQAVRSAAVRQYYSSQTKMQLEIGLDIAEFAKEDIADGVDPPSAFEGLIKKLLDRDEGWKEFYVERMSKLKTESPAKRMLTVYSEEAKAESLFGANRGGEAADVIQTMVDSMKFSPEEKGWYLQEMARYKYSQSKTDSAKLQVAAHTANRYLFKPQTGVTVRKLEVIPLRRVEAIATWAARSPNYDDLNIRVEGILTGLRFGGDSERFELSLQQLGESLGFAAERPDKEWGEGPDDLWCMRKNEYLVIECKNKVKLGREKITKTETGQMNNACAWFQENYGDVEHTNIIVIPPRETGKGASFSEPVGVMREKELRKLIRNTKGFFREFVCADLTDLDPKTIQHWLRSHYLDIDSLKKHYAVSVLR